MQGSGHTTGQGGPEKPGDPAHDSPKRQGDTLERVTGAGGRTGEAGEVASGDSPKPHGDKLEHARDEAAGGSGKG